MYSAKLYRPRETALDFVLTCGEHRIEYRPGYQNGLAMLGHALREAGQPDGVLSVVEIGVKPGAELRHELPSIYTLADLFTPDGVKAENAAVPTGAVTISESAYNNLASLRSSSDAWANVVGRSKVFLVENGLVTVESKVSAEVTAKGVAAMAAFEEAQQAPQIDVVWFRALQRVGKPEWQDVHHNTRAVLVRRGFVTIDNGQALRTADGEAKMQEFLSHA